MSILTTMVSMFEYFKQPLGSWDRLSVTDMAGIFLEWNVSDATDLTDVFNLSGCPGAEGEESVVLLYYLKVNSLLYSELLRHHHHHYDHYPF
jgi:hypothetical protein